ncbi:hypothetical protein HY086_05140 [Candidatus Gottesmanbacteria bacterium]|nr:hypothetical protein [Candidatus Gottesmanbacteria bacterium]
MSIRSISLNTLDTFVPKTDTESMTTSATQPVSPDDVRQSIELAVVDLLKNKVAEGTMTEERSQTIAKMVLELLHPGMDWEVLMKAIPKLDDTASELSPIILPYLRHYEDMVGNKATKRVAELIHVGQFDAAIKLSKQVLAQEGLVMTGTGKNN